MRPAHARTVRRPLAVIIAALAILTIAGCGSPEDGSAPTTTQRPTTTSTTTTTRPTMTTSISTTTTMPVTTTTRDPRPGHAKLFYYENGERSEGEMSPRDNDSTGPAEAFGGEDTPGAQRDPQNGQIVGQPAKLNPYYAAIAIPTIPAEISALHKGMPFGAWVEITYNGKKANAQVARVFASNDPNLVAKLSPAAMLALGVPITEIADYQHDIFGVDVKFVQGPAKNGPWNKQYGV